MYKERMRRKGTEPERKGGDGKYNGVTNRTHMHRDNECVCVFRNVEM